MLQHPSPLLGDAIAARVRAESPQAQVCVSRFEPAVGALLALDTAGVAVDALLLARLPAALPPASLFEMLVVG